VQVTPAHLFGGGAVSTPTESPGVPVSSTFVSSSDVVSPDHESTAGESTTSPAASPEVLPPELLLLHAVAPAETKTRSVEKKWDERMTKIDSNDPLVPGKFASECKLRAARRACSAAAAAAVC
jgi:hypothetical protein